MKRDISQHPNSLLLQRQQLPAITTNATVCSYYEHSPASPTSPLLQLLLFACWLVA